MQNVLNGSNQIPFNLRTLMSGESQVYIQLISERDSGTLETNSSFMSPIGSTATDNLTVSDLSGFIRIRIHANLNYTVMTLGPINIRTYQN